MRHDMMKRLSAVALAGTLLGLGGVAAAPAASAVTGVCGTYGAYSAKNSKCAYLIQSYSRDGTTTYRGTKAGLGKTSDQGVCRAYTSYGVFHKV